MVREHSTKYMGALKHSATLHGATRILKLEEENMGPTKLNGDSYLNSILSIAIGLQRDEIVLVNRSWPVYKSASVTATNIRKGRIPGSFFGDSDRFQVKVIADPDVMGEYTCRIRERRGRIGYW